MTLEETLAVERSVLGYLIEKTQSISIVEYPFTDEGRLRLYITTLQRDIQQSRVTALELLDI